MKLAFRHHLFLFVLLSVLAAACGTSSSTVTGPSVDRCAITVTNSMSSVGASGGSGRVTIAAGRECTWSLTTNVPWITPRPVANGQGDGSVEYVVAANTGTEPRRGSVVVGGQSLEVVQEGISCQFDLQPASQNVGGDGGSGSFTVEAPAACSWTPTASAGWISITNGGSRSGNGSVNFTVAANTGASRDGTISVGAQAFSISQSSAACRFQLSSTTPSFGGAGGSGTVNVSVAGVCAWTAATTVPWIAIVGDADGTGNGTVNFTVQPNTGPARSGIITIGGQRFTVSQQQAACSYSISSSGQSFAAAGGQGTVSVSTNPVCTWNTSDVPSWISGVPASGSGALTIAFTAAANSGPARTAEIIIAGHAFTVSQAGGCTYSLAPGSHSATAAGGASGLSVNTAAGCAWTSSGAPAWITGIPASGTGPATINFMVGTNAVPVPRSATITIAGQPFNVMQAAAACTFSLTPAGHSAAAAGGASTFDINTAASCGWTSSGVPAWITGVPASGTGSRTINFTVAANSGGARSANIVIGGQTFSVTQAAVACSYSLNPTGHNAAAGGGASSFEVTTPSICGWTTSGVPSWISGVPANGTGTTTINFTVAANPDPASRSANISVGGQTFSVTQAAAACNFSLSPGSHNATAGGGASSVDVSTSSGCGWSTSGVPSWMSGVPANGTGPATINFTVAANPDPASRNATITIGGQTFSVIQSAAACSFTLTPNSHNATAAGGASVFDVNTSAACEWTSSGVPSWISGVPANGTGTTTINFTVAANPDPASRNATINIGGRTFSVTQAAAACSFTLNPNSHTATAAGGASTFDVNTTSGCEWTTSGVPSWISGVPPNGTGTTTINFTVAANPDPASRNANINVGGQTFAVTQAAAACSFTLSPTSHNATAAGGASSFDVNTTSGCGWNSSGVPSWISGVPANGTGTTTINFTVAANTGPARNASIVIGSQTFAISQANGCTFAASPQQLTFDVTGGPPKDIAVTAGSSCEWTATASQSWIKILSGSSGTGDGTVRVELLANEEGSARTGNITLGGQTVAVTQNP